ncbi:FIG004694: Hypothetical protein [plant metagenome]|uniref:TPM domain-containing protein n=1 Tax=plant metagenome TaxID=1297885 RepID=A0A484NZ14_9ZZZZ
MEAVVHPVVGKVSGRIASASGWTALAGHWIRWRQLGPAALARLADAIRASEVGHTGELLVVVETALPSRHLDSHERALEVFGRWRVWDTPGRSGVLLYVALGDHRIEIIADRGVPAADAHWQTLCDTLQSALRAGRYLPGLLAAISGIEDTLRATLPDESPGTPNRLADSPLLI